MRLIGIAFAACALMSACATPARVVSPDTPIVVMAVDSASLASVVQAAREREPDLARVNTIWVVFNRAVCERDATPVDHELNLAFGRELLLGRRTLPNGEIVASGFSFAATVPRSGAAGEFELNHVRAFGYKAIALTSGEARWWRFAAPPQPGAVAISDASILLIGPVRMVLGPDNTLALEPITTDHAPLVAAVAAAAGRPASAVRRVDLSPRIDEPCG